MTKNQFLNLKIPVLPYCEFSRGPSTKFSESFSIKNKNKGIVLNFSIDPGYGSVSVGRFDLKEKNPKLRNSTIIDCSKTINEEEIEKICRDNLS